MKEVDVEFEDIVEAARQSNLIKSPYMNILKKKYRPQFIIACIFMIFQQFDVSIMLRLHSQNIFHLQKHLHHTLRGCDPACFNLDSKGFLGAPPV